MRVAGKRSGLLDVIIPLGVFIGISGFRNLNRDLEEKQRNSHALGGKGWALPEEFYERFLMSFGFKTGI